ncbi:hypothetical protein [Enemella evansiae]|uniref:Uncharacterized protein n=1 Tax=Enemella evansiae TaxID=2016499 RepID=A0A255FX55_9ACTN|nr:hypothetical protein [Enemella evansiae]OYN93469.1 hypothetical protein CGZ95_19185 [Enemella evansiae]OYO05865.1 hypothetical protein CGZ97_04025 [Enemella evansiae]OYO07892.1 hypothetical protein CGZ94_20710 [Enemella evansiae]OYO14984.1 hypothetical protein CGZ98_00600 [Enemella evansiae]
MPLFRRQQPKLDKTTADGLAEAYTQRFDRRIARPIVATENDGLWTVLLPDALAVQRGDGWDFVGWHEIDRGGWNSQNSELRWELVDGRRGSVLLDNPGRVPEVFAERVAASIVVQQHLDIEGTREGAVVSARRDLGDRSAPLLWRTRRGRGTPDSAEVRELLGAETRRLQSDYDI